MNSSGDALARVAKPLRCTALHQSTVATSPGHNRTTSRADSPVQSSSQDSDDDQSSKTSQSSQDEEMQGDISPGVESKSFQPSSFELRRASTALERRARRPSSTAKLKNRYKGLTLNHTSPTTAVRAINDVFTKRELSYEKSKIDFSPENERVSFMAELPEAIARARKVHYRRDALLPKPKSFSRVQKALREDSAPCEVDVQKEATLAKILKDKANASQSDTRSSDVLGAPFALHNNHERKVHGSLTEGNGLRPGKLMDNNEREEMLFNMDDITTSISTGLTSPTSVIRDADSEQRSPRGLQGRVGRSSKRKMEDARYEPYAISMKRRAVSPSPSSPLGSPNVKGNIVRMEDLSL